MFIDRQQQRHAAGLLLSALQQTGVRPIAGDSNRDLLTLSMSGRRLPNVFLNKSSTTAIDLSAIYVPVTGTARVGSNVTSGMMSVRLCVARFLCTTWRRAETSARRRGVPPHSAAAGLLLWARRGQQEIKRLDCRQAGVHTIRYEMLF